MIRLSLPLLLLLIVSQAVSPSGAGADEWPEFRGPNGDGHSAATGLPAQWSESKNVAWKTRLPGRGWSTPVVLGSEIWMTTSHAAPASEEEKQRRLAALENSNGLDIVDQVVMSALCVDRDSGRLLHEIEVLRVDSPEPIHTLNSFASPTPVIEEGRLYCHFGTYGTLCLDTTTRRVLWRTSEFKLDHQNGPGSSPVLWNDLLIFHCDGMDVQYIAALDKRTGKLAWKTDRSGEMHERPPYRKAYCTPLIVTDRRGRTQLISPAADWVYSYDPASGRELWKARYGKLGFSNVARPVADEEAVYICTCFMTSSMLAIRYDGDGDVTKTHILWQHDKQMPKMPSPILVGGELYVINDGGIASCLDKRTGELLWRERLGGNFSASPVLAEDRLYAFNQEGKAYVLRPDRTYHPPQINELAEGCMASPVALGRSLLVRTESHLYRIERPAGE